MEAELLDPVEIKECLHIVSGEVAAATFRAAFPTAKFLLVLRDALFAGPVFNFTHFSGFVVRRKRFLNTLYPGLGDDVYRWPSDIAFEAELSLDRPILIWTGVGLEDSLFLLLVTHLVDTFSAGIDRIRVIRFDPKTSGGFALNQITTAMVRLFPEPFSLLPDRIAFYRRAWNNFTSASPCELDSLFAEDSVPDPCLLDGLRHILLRYPDPRSGLPVWEWRLLQSAINNPGPIDVVIRESIPRQLVGDSTKDYLLMDAAIRMSNGGWGIPLLRLHRAQTPHATDSHVEVTKEGLAVAERKLRVTPNRDKPFWIGGACLPLAGYWYHYAGRLTSTSTCSN